MHKRILTFGTLALMVAACTVTSTTTNPSSPGGASSAQIGSCKQSCDKMKFFGCNSADQQAACYSDCDQATPAQIQVFTGCADNSVCDPACRTNIAPKPAGGGGGGTTGSGASASSCSTACGKLVSCSLIRLGDQDACNTQCQKSAYQYQIDCVNNTACASIVSACGNPTGSGSGGSGGGGSSSGSTSGSTSGGVDAGNDQFDIQVCQSACDSLNFFACLSADDHAACRDLCATATSAKRSTFTSCANGAGSDCTRGSACYATFKN